MSHKASDYIGYTSANAFPPNARGDCGDVSAVGSAEGEGGGIVGGGESD